MLTMEIGYFGGAEHQPLPASWPNSPSLLKHGDSRRAWEEGLDNYLYADELGFDFVTASEHHYSAWMDPNPALTAAVLSQQLRRARLYLLGLTLPMLNPVRVAEELALLDVMANGQLTVALLRGTPNEVMTYYNINPTESRARFQEAVELVKACWNEPEPFAWEGRFYRFRTVAVWPRAVTLGGPRLLMSGSNSAAIDFVVRHRADLGLSYTDLSDTAERVQMYYDAAQQAGWEANRSNVLYRNVCYVADTDEQALADVNRYEYGSIKRLFQPGSQLAATATMEAVSGSFQHAAPSQIQQLTAEFAPPLFCGSPATVIEQLKDFHDAGVGKVDLTFSGLGLPREHARKSMELFASEVLPAVHEFSDDVVRV
jgi:alkanesulfonate monooxygenase SsuD/methylene tetrahydromethanopterin reductase-like flavin-dependent oxidoreductase (luciferase family)